MNSETLREELATVLTPHIGFYDFGVAGQSGSKTAALITAYDSQSHSDRRVSGLEVVILKLPQVSIKGEIYQIYLKQYSEGFQGLDGAIAAIQTLYPLATFIPLPQPENSQIWAIVSCKIPMTPIMG